MIRYLDSPQKPIFDHVRNVHSRPITPASTSHHRIALLHRTMPMRNHPKMSPIHHGPHETGEKWAPGPCSLHGPCHPSGHGTPHPMHACWVESTAGLHPPLLVGRTHAWASPACCWPNASMLLGLAMSPLTCASPWAPPTAHVLGIVSQSQSSAC